MYHKQLVNHAYKKLKEGASADSIRSELKADGWSDDDIKESLYYASHPNKLMHFPLVRALHSEIPVALAIFTTLAIVAIVAGAFYFLDPLRDSFKLPISESKDLEFTYGSKPALQDPDFFQKTKNSLLVQGVSFIEADLSAMQLRVYKEGKKTLEVPIASKGREGSWWETPAGLYKVNSKERRHFSGMGHVWMPWSLNFQGNFYIHGETYYPDGSPTSAQFTGGCIRLFNKDAEKIYDQVETGTPILVFEQSFAGDGYTYKNEVGPNISVESYISADLRNDHVFANMETAKELPIASLTKLMTALVATEYLNLDGMATVPKEAIVFTSKPRLEVGESYKIYQLLFPLLMESSNEAAEAIARYYGRQNFIARMNAKAQSIGMTHTKFNDPSGASSANVSTVEDLFKLTKYIYNNRSFIFNITSGKIKSSAYGTDGFPDLQNFNYFVQNINFFGGKNGKTTAAQETNVSVFELPVNGVKRPIAIIILGSQNVEADSQKILEYTINHLR